MRHIATKGDVIEEANDHEPSVTYILGIGRMKNNETTNNRSNFKI